MTPGPQARGAGPAPERRGEAHALTVFDLTSLQYALLAQELRSFRRVAQLLDVQPSVVSRRIRAFEDAILVSLFNRTRKGLEPTVAGERLLARGRAIVTDIDLLVRTAALNGGGLEGRLRIGIIGSIAAGVTHDLLDAFVTTHPHVELEIVEGLTRELISSVRSHTLDLAFVTGEPLAPDCDVEPLWSETIMVALPSRHPLATASELSWVELATEKFIVSRTDPGPEIHDFLVKRMGDIGRHPQIDICTAQRECLMALVGLGQGCSLVGAAEAGVNYPGVSFRPIKGERLPFSAVWSARNDNPVLRRFLSLSRVQTRKLARAAAMS